VVGGGDVPERVDGAAVSANLFPLLGVQLARGRGFQAEEDRPGGPPVVILSDALWRRRFSEDPAILGRAVRVNGESYTVVGIMPAHFAFPSAADLWLPIESSVSEGARDDRRIGVVARLAPGVTVEQADADMKRVAAQLERQYPETQKEWTAGVVGLSSELADVGPYFWVLQGAVAFVLLIACANIAGLLVARAAGRAREMAIRVATGASRSRIVRQLLTESLVVALAGGGLGLLAAWQAVRIVAVQASAGLPWFARIGVDGSVVIFCVVTTLLTGLAFGLLPALNASRPDVHDTLKTGSLSISGARGHSRLRAGLVVTELTLALVLLCGAGLMIKTFLRLDRTPTGFSEPEKIMLAELVLLDRRFDDPAQLRTQVDELLQRLARLPAATVAVSHWEFIAGFGTADRKVMVEGKPELPAGVSPRFYYAVTPAYFDAYGLSVLAGRALGAQDGTGRPPVVVVDAAMAKNIWGGGSPVGARIRLGSAESGAPWRTVVGVVGARDIVAAQPGAGQSYAYIPFAQGPGRPAQLVIRAPGDPLALVPAIRAELAGLSVDLPLEDIRTLETDINRRFLHVRIYALALSALGAFAALLAAIGVSGIVAYAVGQRRREIGIRMALGATAARVLGMIASQGLRLALIGLALGLVASAALTRVIGSLLYGTSPLDPLVFVAVSLVFAAIALLASLVPARRAARVDPMIALRAE
jgi:predicted permease